MAMAALYLQSCNPAGVHTDRTSKQNHAAGPDHALHGKFITVLRHPSCTGEAATKTSWLQPCLQQSVKNKTDVCFKPCSKLLLDVIIY